MPRCVDTGSTRHWSGESGATPDQDSGYVFTGLHGDPLAPDRLTRAFRQLTVETGLPPIRLHDLRHGAATLALSAGMDLRVVQDMLGHRSIVLTADTYTSVLSEVAHKAAEQVAALILRAGGWYPAPPGRVGRPASPDVRAATEHRSSTAVGRRCSIDERVGKRLNRLWDR